MAVDPRIGAVIFDLDGVLIDSEPLWRRAEIDVLTPLGVPLTEEMCRQTQGTRVDRAITHWFERYPWDEPPVDDVARHTVERVIELIGECGEAMPGAVRTVRDVVEAGIPTAVCSSSWTLLIDAALARIGLDDVLSIRHSAENETYGKPHPAAYLTTAAKLGVPPTACIVIEDSFNGAIAGKAALMSVIAVPEPFLRDSDRWGFCDLVLDSLEDLTCEHWASLVG